MRLGCVGCLGTLLGLTAVLASIAGGAWAWNRIWASPPLLAASHARSDASGVGRKLAELDRGTGRPAGRPETVTLSQAEVSVAAARFLEDAGLLTSSFTTEMHEGWAVVQWRGPVGMLLQGPPFQWVAPVLTRRMRESTVWITLTGGIELQPGPAPGRPCYAEVSIASARVGRLPVPGWLLTVMSGSRGASLLRWSVPATVDRLELGEGRVTIRTR